MATFFKGPMWASLVFAFVGIGKVYAGFYDEVKLRAEQGDPEAQDVLSYMYESGKGVPKDLNQARRWASLAKRGGIGDSKMSPQRPRVGYPNYAVRASPRRPMVNTSSYQRPRMSPRRPGSYSVQTELRAIPRRPTSSTAIELARVGYRGSELGIVEQGVRNYQRGKKWHQRMAKGSKILVSPVTFTFKQSRRVVTKAVRKATFGGMVLY